MSKKYGERMAEWERTEDERDWKRRCEIAFQKGDKSAIVELIKEGEDNEYEAIMILRLKEQL